MIGLKRVAVWVAAIFASWFLMIGFFTFCKKSASWLADSLDKSIAYEQDRRGEETRERISANSVAYFIRGEKK